MEQIWSLSTARTRGDFRGGLGARTRVLRICSSAVLLAASLFMALVACPTVAMAFTPRMTAPSTSDFHYYSSQNPFVAAGWGLPNCTCYAWGRAWEVRGTPLPGGYLGNAKDWWNATALSKGSSPALGAIAVWGGAPGLNGNFGHVAVVEAISGSSVTVSQSNHLGRVFDTQTVQEISTTGGCGSLLGYIYTIDSAPPAVHYNPIAPGDPGFTRYGPADGWYNNSADPQGQTTGTHALGWFDSAIYTYVCNTGRGNYGVWTFDLSKINGDGNYQVEAWMPFGHGGTQQAHYQINTSTGVQVSTVNQRNYGMAWVNLGTYPLSTGSVTIELDDNTGEAWAYDLNHQEVFDAIRLTYVAPRTYTLAYTAGTGGTISGTANQTVASGASGTAVTTVANAGYHFVSWSDGRTTAARTDSNVAASATYSATFAINAYTLTYTAGPNGTISGTSPQTVNYNAGGTAVTAVPITGHHFVSWSDGVATATRTDLAVLSDLTVTASFAANVLPKATVYTPVAPSSVTHSHAFTVYGYVAPRHTSGTYLATLKFYLRNSHGVYVFHDSVNAKRYYYSTTKTKYKASVALPHTGKWRVRAYHSDSGHSPSYSGYDYITVK